IISGVAAALGLGAGCEKRTSDETARTSPTAPSSGSKSDTSASPSSDMNKQPVSGSTIYFVTDDGTRKELQDTSTLSEMQQKLAKEGLYTGSIDGRPSPELTSALRRFQARNGIPDTAVVDHATANKLGLDWDKITKSSASDVKDDLKKAGEKVKDTASDVGKDIKKDVTK